MAMTVRRRTESRRAEIVESVLISAGVAGPARLTTAEMAAAVGLTHAAIFRHFPTKNDLWDAVGERIEKETDALNADVLACSLNASALMERFIELHASLSRRWPALHPILLSREIHFQNSALQACFRRIEAKLFNTARAIIDRGLAQGDFRADLSTEDAALAIMSLIRGAAPRWGRPDDAHDSGSQIERLWPVLAIGLSADRRPPR